MAVEPRKAKVGRRRAGFQAVTFDLAPGQGTISETSGTFFLAPLWTTLARRMGEGLGVRAAICQGEQRVCTHDQAAGDFSFSIDQVPGRRAGGLICRDDFHLLLQQHGESKLVSGEKLTVFLHVAGGDNE